MRNLLRSVEQLWRTKPKKEAQKAEKNDRIIQTTTEYLNVARGYVSKVKFTISILRGMGILDVFQDVRLLQIEEYIDHAERQIDQVERRVIHDEKIPHEEKVFSIFEPHTEWIQKGKAGVTQELGLRISLLKDQFGFILHHKVMERQTDDKVAVPMVQETKDRFPVLVSCSFDKGYYSPENKEKLKGIIDEVILPKKGKLSGQDKEEEHSEEFIHARRKHSGVESAINALENHGLDRCLDHGIDGFKRYVALAVVARNIQIIGHVIQQKQLKRLKRTEKNRLSA